MGCDLYTRPTIQIPDQCPRKQDDIHLSGFQMVRLSGIKIIFKNRTFGIQPLFNHLNTKPVLYSDPPLYFSGDPNTRHLITSRYVVARNDH